MQENAQETLTHKTSKKTGDSSITGPMTSKELFYKQKPKKTDYPMKRGHSEDVDNLSILSLISGIPSSFLSSFHSSASLSYMS